MEILNDILFWIHLVALAIGGSASFGLFVMRPFMRGATAETRPTLFQIGAALSRNGMIALALLLVTGPLLVWLKYGGLGGVSVWFWVKMALILVQVAAIAVAGRARRRIQAGDMSAAPTLTMASNVSIGAFILVILSAVIAFN